MMLVARHEATKPQQPGKEALDAPAATIPSELASVLRQSATVALVGRDHVDAHLGELGIQRVIVIGAVPDESFWQRLHESCVESIEHQRCFMALTTRYPNGDRKTVAVCHRHDLGRLASSCPSYQLSTPLGASMATINVGFGEVELPNFT